MGGSTHSVMIRIWGKKKGKMGKMGIIIHVCGGEMGIIHFGQHHTQRLNQDLEQKTAKMGKTKIIIHVWGGENGNYLCMG